MRTVIITAPESIKDETRICNLLFDNGLEILHLRKPHSNLSVYEEFIGRIDPRYYNRIVIHEYYDLAEKYKLLGIHLKFHQADTYFRYTDIKHISVSCHSLEEIAALPFKPAYCFLSPIFDSISKCGYISAFKHIPDLNSMSGLPPVIALGGITPEKTGLCRQQGFQGIAVLGYIWEYPSEALSRYIRLKTPEVTSIAGFDPSAGAGILADIKTFENTGSYGRGICSAITFQNEQEYHSTHWINTDEIITQCDLQFQKALPQYIKIGLIENLKTLYRLTIYLKQIRPDIRVIWDPILQASSGHVFHQQFDLLNDILPHIYLITPNTDELFRLFGETITTERLKELCKQYHINILWKGGHNQGTQVEDCLITSDEIHRFSVQRGKYGKHGTGCVLSSAIASFLSQGFALPTACMKAQVYVSNLINSNNSILGYHSITARKSTLKPNCKELRVQYITDYKEGITISEQIEKACQGGLQWVQLRMKETTDTELLQEALLAKEICKRYNALLIINDNVSIARQADADGVHLGKEDMDPVEARKILGKDKIIGATCNTFEDIILRHHQQVDYIGLGPFAYTTTKKKLSPVLGLSGYSSLIEQMEQAGISIPVFAIGGITDNDIFPLLKTGIQGIALSGLIKNSYDITEKTKEILQKANHIQD